LKLSSVFAQYLYQNKKMNLPGIGTFEIDPSIPLPDSSDKNATKMHPTLNNISALQKGPSRSQTTIS
jgi:hypothetical protein